MIETDVHELDYFLPEDGDAAQKEFLSILNGGYDEIWISAFGFTLQPMFDAIEAADARGVKCHLLLDHTQSGGIAEASKVKHLAKVFQNSDLTITTAGINAHRTSNIWHTKGFVAKFADGNMDVHRFGSFEEEITPAYFCWEGSVNFSVTGFDQGNTARVFCNDVWAQTFIHQFEIHRQWAIDTHPQWQLQK